MKLRTAALMLTLVLSLLAPPLVAEAQQVQKIPRIGLLLPGSASSFARRVEAFHHGLRDLGYVAGENIVMEYRYAKGNMDQLPNLAAGLSRLKVDVIMTVGTPATQAAKNATTTIPVVMFVGAPVKAGLVASLARPGGNVTGLSLLNPELSGKRLELLKEVVAGLSHIAILSNPTNPAVVIQLRQAEVAARALGVRLLPLAVRGPDDFEGAFQAAIRERAGALLALDDPLTVAYRTKIVELAAKSRLPAIYGFREFAKAGGLMTYGSNISDLWRRAATYVDKILKGAKPAELPVEQPTKFDLIINLKTANTLGLTIPDSLLFQADKVIK